MKSEKEIEERIEFLEKEYLEATKLEDSDRALIMFEMLSMISALEWVLEDDE